MSLAWDYEESGKGYYQIYDTEDEIGIKPITIEVAKNEQNSQDIQTIVNALNRIAKRKLKK